ncbi:hypothetical protein KIM67_07405 [Flagellimonas sp. 389]|uniref:hypothetical protein n=1 Tax=Flagellimonas sp. 389 TaxID=2835862 RepID=UPI001BD1D1DC|nr:hypothetical protein [Flagellimonas sp. 389]MBS9462232.1 hypothetical protein [Flagellimonas sp. 389]
MKTNLFNLKWGVLGIVVSLMSCVSDDLAEVGDNVDLTGPTPFYNLADISTSEFDCNDVELSANYEINFQAGSNLAVNGTQYQWSVEPAEGITLIHKDLPILKQLIEAELATVVALEEEIAKIEFRIPCEDDLDRVEVLEAEVAALEAQLALAEAAVSDETRQNVKNLEDQIAALPPATLQDRELIISFPGPGDYNVGLVVTDNLGKSETTERTVTVNQAVPTIAVPEIAEPSFEDNSLFDGTGDGRDSWRAPNNDDWSPFGAGTTVIQINSTSIEGRLPDGFQAAKFPSDGARVAYQEIDVTPGAEYVLTYFSEFDDSSFGDITVSILNPDTANYTESLLDENIVASRTDSNVGRVSDVFKQHAITFEAGENESVIIYVTNTGVESRLDSFAISVKQ